MSVANQALDLHIDSLPAHAVDLTNYRTETLRVLREQARDLNKAVNDAIEALEIEEDLIRRIKANKSSRQSDLQAHRRLTSTSRYYFTPSSENCINLTADVVPFNVFMLLVEYLTFPSLKVFMKHKVAVKRTVELLKSKDLHNGWYPYHRYLQITYPDRAEKFLSEVYNYRNETKLPPHIQHHVDEGPHLKTSKYQTPYCAAVTVKNFKNLDNDSRDFAAILVFMGGAVSEHIIKIGTAYSLISVLTDAYKLQLATQNLLSLGLITLQDGIFLAHPSLRLYIEELIPNPMLWQVEASKFFFSFHFNQHADTFYTDLERSQLQHVLSYFNEPNFLRYFSHGELIKVVENCMLCTYFSSLKTTANAKKTMEVIGIELSARFKILKQSLGTCFPSVQRRTAFYIAIPSLLCAMGGRIPKVMLDRAITPRQRWSERGDLLYVTSRDSSLHEDIATLLLDGTDFNEGIGRLIQLSIIRQEITADGGTAYICQDESACISYNQNRAYWIRQAFGLCCHVFPRDRVIDPSFGSVGKKLFSILQHLLQLHAKTGLEVPRRSDAVETLVAASNFGNMKNKQRLIAMAANLQKGLPDTHLQAVVAHRKSVLLRLNWDISSSRHVIQEFLDRPRTESNPRLHSLFGLLHISQAENWAYQFQYQKAWEEAQKWELSNNTPSNMELYVLRTKLSSIGMSFKGGGQFEDAKSSFEGCLAAMIPSDPSRFFIKSNLGDVYCELDYERNKARQTPNVEYLDKAEDLVKPEIEQLRAHSSQSKHFRRMLLSLTEIQNRRGRFHIVESLVKELLAIYDRLTEPDAIDRVGHVRTLIAWARISPLSEAAEHWNAALRQNKIYNPFEEEVFTCGVIYLFLSSIRYKLRDLNGSIAAFNHAKEIISRKVPQFLIPGVGTYLFNSVQLELQSVAGWRLLNTDVH